MEGEDLNLLGSECHPSSGKQGNPDVNVQYGESKDVASESKCNQALTKDDCNKEVVGAVHLIQAKLYRHRKMVRMQVTGVSCEDCNFILFLFEPDIGELEEKCLLRSS